MFVIQVLLEVEDQADVDDIREQLRRAGQLSREEPGCLRFEVCQDQQNPTTFLLSERWADRDAWETHKTATAFTTIYQPRVLPRVRRTPFFCDLIE